MKKGLWLLLSPFLILFCLEWIFWQPKFIYFYLAIANVVLFFIFTKNKSKKLSLIAWLNFLILPAIFFNSLTAFILIINSRWLAQFLLILGTVWLWLYFRNFAHRSFTLEDRIFILNTSSVGTFLSILFASSAAYGFQAFLNTKIYYLLPILAIVVLLLVYAEIWFNNLSLKKHGWMILILSLIILEIASVLFLLPLNHQVAGLIVALTFFTLMRMYRFFCQETLRQRNLTLYIVFYVSSLVLLLLTAHWV